MPVFYDPLVVLLSILVAIQGAVVSLTLTHALRPATLLRRKLLLAAAATVMGVGIWSMHFIGMLALHLPVAVAYDPLPTLTSGLVCILVTGLGFHIVSQDGTGPARIMLGGAVMGLGIAAMHYLGMSALRAQCVVTYSPPLVALSVAVGVAAATAALWLAFRPGATWVIRAASVVLGLAVALMHFTGMAAASFLPAEGLELIAEPLLDQGALALVVAVVAFLISGVFLLVILPDRPAAPAAHEPQVAPAAPVMPERVAVQQRGATLLLDPGEIRAIQAEGHYTRISDGRGSYLCPQSITVLGGRLDPAQFLRVHRSHIVNRRWIRGFRRDGDQGVVIVEAEPTLEVPVSRTNVRKIQDTLLPAA
jgi:NO-binding membrane sensor protein with MHYT domain